MVLKNAPLPTSGMERVGITDSFLVTSLLPCFFITYVVSLRELFPFLLATVKMPNFVLGSKSFRLFQICRTDSPTEPIYDVIYFFFSFSGLFISLFHTIRTSISLKGENEKSFQFIFFHRMRPVCVLNSRCRCDLNHQRLHPL